MNKGDIVDSSEVKFFKNELLTLKNSIGKNIHSAEKEITLMRNQSPTDDGDYAVLMNDTSIDDTLIANQMQKLKEIDEALDKIANGNYGICDMCEEPISVARLQVKPYAKYCIACREINEKESSDK